ncbi:NTP transferase domain-containing protein [bacterium]|nr:NTP transferase domain-containing protein [bacterium]
MSRRAVVLAGGQGQRLRPYTTVLPKPLMPVGDRPILHRVLSSLGAAGFGDITISVGHLAELIMVFFGKGEKLGIKIDYAIEDMPLGTIGPLAFIHNLGDDFLVMNGDLLTDIDFEALWRAHHDSKATLTIATFDREVKIDFGVLQRDAAEKVVGFVEKPRIPYTVSMGVYILNKRCLDYVPRGEHFGFDQLVLALLAANEPIHSFRHTGRWLDLGRPEDYEAANDLFS